MPHTYETVIPASSLDADFERLRQDAFCSVEELQDMPFEARFATGNLTDFVNQALQNQLEDPIAPGQAWRYAAQYLGQLHQESLGKEVRNGDSYEDSVINNVKQSVMRERLNPEDASSFLDVLEEVVASRSWESNITDMLLRRDNFQVLSDADDVLVRERYEQLLVNNKVLLGLGSAYNNPATGKLDRGRQDRAWVLLHDALSLCGIEDPVGCLSAWEDRPEDHMRAIANLEEQRPGSVKLLNNFYGIRHFGRWPLAALINQIDNHGNTDKEYGIVAAAVWDNNRAFASMHRQYSLFTEQNGTNVRIIEAESSPELVRRFIGLDTMYGSKQKISFAYIHAHGNPKYMQLGHRHGSSMNNLVLENAFGGAQRWFVEGPTIVLASCSTGEQNGMAQKISEELDATVIGPDTDTGVYDLHVVRQNGQLKIEPVYGSGNPLAHEPIVFATANMYRNGVLVPHDSKEYKDYFAEVETDEASRQ